MKLLLPAILFAFAALSLNGQNWALFGSAPLNFSNPQVQQPLARSISISPNGVVGTDSTFLATPRGVELVFLPPYVQQVGDILGDSIVRRTNGDYEFYFLPANPPLAPANTTPFLIRSQAQPGESWMFRDPVTAEVVSAQEQTTFGVPDSVKTLALSDGRTVLISKTFGLLQLGDFHLAGLEGTNVGVQLPNNLDWYGWATGDTYHFYETRASGATWGVENSYKTWRKLLIQEKTVSPAEITFTVRSLVKTEYYHFEMLLSTVFTDTILPFVVAAPAETQVPGYFPGATFCGYGQCSYALSDSGWVKSIKSVNPPGCMSEVVEQTFVQGLGKTHNYHQYSGPGGFGSNTEDLVGYQKNGQAAQGTVYGNDFFGATGIEDLSSASGPRVYPNPVRGLLNVELQAGAVSVELFDLNGRKMRSARSDAQQIQLSTEGLRAGLYVLKIGSDRGAVWVRRLVLEN